MYTILMKTDKSLITVNKITLFQREKLVDKICFLIPQTYENTKIFRFWKCSTYGRACVRKRII